MTWGIGSYNTVPGSNSNINGINIAEGCAASGIDDAIRQLMADIATYGFGSESTTGNAGTATKLATARTIAATGDITWTSPAFDGSANVTAAATLATTGVGAAAYTYASVTVDAKGRITAASNGAAFGASGASHSAGIVPDPGSSAGTKRFLREDATWAAPNTTFSSLGNAVPSNANASVAHGLGAAPRDFWAELRCVSNDSASGYSSGDIVTQIQSTGSNGFQPWKNASNLGVSCGGLLVLVPKGGAGGAVQVTSSANFVIDFYARLSL